MLVDIPGKRGDTVAIRHADVLEHGELGTRPLRTARAENIIHLGGKTKSYESRYPEFEYLPPEHRAHKNLASSGIKS